MLVVNHLPKRIKQHLHTVNSQMIHTVNCEIYWIKQTGTSFVGHTWGICNLYYHDNYLDVVAPDISVSIPPHKLRREHWFTRGFMRSSKTVEKLYRKTM